MKNNKHYDAIVIGSGQAGNPIAFEYASKKLRVALIENNKLGGSCINYGCIPSKALIASSELYNDMKKSEDLGIRAENIQTDFQKIIQRKNKIVEDSRSSIEKSVEDNEYIHLYRGTASFIDDKNINIDLFAGNDIQISADKIFINTGSSPNIIELQGLSDVKYYDSTSIMELTQLPEHLVIIGTGYIALELGQMYAKLGSKVTMIGRGDTIIDKEYDDISDEIKKILEKDGIVFKLNKLSKSVSEINAKIEVSIEENKSEDELKNNIPKEKITGSHLLIATGRNPNSKALKLQNTGIKTDEKGYIKTNKYLETDAENVFALGDVKGGPKFTHVSYDDYRVVMDHIFGEKKRNIDDRILSYTLYTQPQLGRIGMNERQAKKEEIDYKVMKLDMRHVSRAVAEAKTDGFMKALIDKKTNKILGASILGYQGGEVMAMIQIAMIAELKCDILKNAMFSHPSISESLNNLFNEC